ncbi:MAG: phage major capsid protein [Enhydrobacter sp.]|nr:phage major capsid protein [Enhydrobacter sp.]
MTAQFRNYLANPLETKAEGDDADPIKALEALGGVINTKLEGFAGELKKIGDRVDTEIAKRNRPGTETKEEGSEVETKAFTVFLRKGREALASDEVKALRVSDDTQGGYLAPAEFSAEIDKNLVQFSPVREAARVGPTSSGSVIIPRRTGKPTGYWVGETETRTATQSAYGQVEIPVDEMACYVDVSNKLLEDAAVDVGAEVAFDLAEEFGRLEGASFVAGDGVKKPLGFMSDTNVAYTPSGSASVIADADGGVDGLIDLMYAMHPFYRSRGVWMANGTTIGKLRKLKDADKNYIWQKSIQEGQPDTLLGRPIIEAPDMPDISGGTYPLVFGDFGIAYRIYDRVGMSILRDPYTQATSGLVRFHARKRVGGRLVRPEAIRKLKIGTS